MKDRLEKDLQMHLQSHRLKSAMVIIRGHKEKVEEKSPSQLKRAFLSICPSRKVY
jgi:hypothetical protein